MNRNNINNNNCNQDNDNNNNNENNNCNDNDNNDKNTLNVNNRLNKLLENSVVSSNDSVISIKIFNSSKNDSLDSKSNQNKSVIVTTPSKNKNKSNNKSITKTNSSLKKSTQKSYISKYIKEFSRLALKTPDILNNNEEDKNSFSESGIISSSYLSTSLTSNNNSILKNFDTSTNISYNLTEDINNLSEDVININSENNNTQSSKLDKNSNYSSKSNLSSLPYKRKLHHYTSNSFCQYDNSLSSSSHNIKNHSIYEPPISLRNLSSNGGSLRDDFAESYYSRHYQNHHYESNNNSTNSYSSVIPSSSVSIINSHNTTSNSNTNSNSGSNIRNKILPYSSPLSSSNSPIISSPILGNTNFSQNEIINLASKTNNNKNSKEISNNSSIATNLDTENHIQNQNNRIILSSINNISHLSDDENYTDSSGYFDFSNGNLSNICKTNDNKITPNLSSPGLLNVSNFQEDLIPQEEIEVNNDEKEEETLDAYALLSETSYSHDNSQEKEKKKIFMKDNKTLNCYLSKLSLKNKGKKYKQLYEEDEEKNINTPNDEAYSADKNKATVTMSMSKTFVKSTTLTSSDVINMNQNIIVGSLLQPKPVYDKCDFRGSNRKDIDEFDSKNTINISSNITNIISNKYSMNNKNNTSLNNTSLNSNKIQYPNITSFTFKSPNMNLSETLSPLTNISNTPSIGSSPIIPPSSKKLKFDENDQGKEDIDNINSNREMVEKNSTNMFKEKIKHYYFNRLSYITNTTITSQSNTSSNCPNNNNTNAINTTSKSNNHILGIGNKLDNKLNHRISYDENVNYGDLNGQSSLIKSLNKYIPSILKRQEKNKVINENIQNLEYNKNNTIGIYSSNINSDVYEKDWSKEMVKNGILTNRLISITLFIFSLFNIIPYIILNYCNITIYQWFVISYFYTSILSLLFCTLYKWGKLYILSYKHRSIIYLFFANVCISISLLDWLYNYKEIFSLSLIFLILESLTDIV
ncbi:hypothetical protein BCR36DRAFT_125619 [Piromyces finnis]|uniref:Uncharacterized protein n=1 Tax=Piromyces finnis TaxID=1754191 RepID=A0A1Y1V0R0_9FUNG|nr:hypothetical protein BCR36DRAFT_125619 [Piromyces finnis]|eukprot:ORX44726.1 hypothetical protein BCR36DRAFT_125619 [Piromyces finnis]